MSINKIIKLNLKNLLPDGIHDIVIKGESSSSSELSYSRPLIFLGRSLEMDGLEYTRAGNNRLSVSEVVDNSLTKVIIPSSIRNFPVTNISSTCFKYKTSTLNTIEIGESVLELYTGSFVESTSLKEVVIKSKNITFIPAGCFKNCTSLSSITLPSSIKSIAGGAESGGGEANTGAFFGCKSLNTIIYDGPMSQWDAISKGEYWNQGMPSKARVYCTNGSKYANA